ncbi:error-prone DNA polymerase [Tahibacter sp. BL]|uniref:Error-prone DNA polymerase n=2 Tax=Tahibacter soli TaxID=2983605 RepID=A0A9X3YJN4_9GAMM|nr:error-prone DNA polymerase [Tahibacter soli]MDC8012286.1 error-prone DNA polymerase [Tahibacter soli]
MSGKTIDLAERRRLRDARRAAQGDAAIEAPSNAMTLPTATPSPASALGGEGWDEGATPDASSSLLQAETSAAASICAIANDRAGAATALPLIPYAELHCLSDFSFQRGASSAPELFDRAKKLGYRALAITDECSLAGIVRAFNASRDTGVPLVVGSEFTLDDGIKLVLLVENQNGYTELCRLITDARRRSEKGEYRIARGDFRAAPEGLLALWLPSPGHRANDDQAAWIKAQFPARAWIGVELHRGADDTARLDAWQALGARHQLPLVAAGDAHMHVRRRRALQDVMTAIRIGTTVANAGAALHPNGERHLRRIEQLRAIYPEELIARSVAIAARCTFRLGDIRYEYPHEVVPAGIRASTHLAALTWAGAAGKWEGGPDEHTRRQIEKELALIEKLKYEHFFLTVHDIVRWARAQEPPILCQGRGSAANSAVCYCLGITSIDPVRGNLLFERFISEERDEPPDIDVDFEHERREEVIQYVFGKYGRHRAALAATVIMYRRRSAARDVGRALGLSDDQLNLLSNVYSYGHGEVPLFQRLAEAGFDPDSRLMRQLIVLVEELRGSPRHLSQHVGGFVISEHPLTTLVPVENAAMPDRTVIQWDKDDLESLKLLKVDCLALGMLTCLRKCFDLLRAHEGADYELHTLPPEDPATYEMIRKADTIGVFQIESRAQMSMLPRLKPANFYDLVIEIAIVRPGPIEGGMVHPFLRRRAGLEKIDYPRSSLPDEAGDLDKKGRIEKILERTCGVPIFQEQVMKLVQEVAGFTGGMADQLRRSMGSWRNDGQVEIFRDKIYKGMHDRGYGDFADRLYSQIKGFGSYGFPESHSASFALLAYASSWLKCHRPAVFACALINSQPMGFYAPTQIVQDARRHGVDIRPPDVAASDWDCTLERADDGALALRLGLRLVKGMSETAALRIVAARANATFDGVADIVRRAALTRRERDCLAEAGAFKQVAGHRHRARWDSAGAERDLPVLAGAAVREARIALRPPSTAENVLTDYATLGLSLERHPIGLIRGVLDGEHRRSSRVLGELVNGTPVRTAGLVTVRQRPPEAGGATFMTLEDEYGQINLVIWRDVAERYRRPLLESTILGVDGMLQEEQNVRHVIAQRLIDLSGLLPQIGSQSRDFH